MKMLVFTNKLKQIIHSHHTLKLYFVKVELDYDHASKIIFNNVCVTNTERNYIDIMFHMYSRASPLSRTHQL